MKVIPRPVLPEVKSSPILAQQSEKNWFSRLEHFLDNTTVSNFNTNEHRVMAFTYVQLQRNQSLLYSYTQAMVILGDGNSFEFIHNFPSGGLMSIENLLEEWMQATGEHTAESLQQFVTQWRNRRKWVVLKNKHFFDCFAIPLAALQKARGSSAQRAGDAWWLQRL